MKHELIQILTPNGPEHIWGIKMSLSDKFGLKIRGN